MSAKAIVTRAVILAVLGGWTARAAAQAPDVPGQPSPTPAAPASPVPAVIPPPSQIPAMQAGLPPGSVPDPWITYDRPGCCGPIGADGPIDSELYSRSGVSIPTAHDVLHDSLNAGWATEVGGRALFFNKDTTAAWTGDLGIDYTYNDAGGGHQFLLNVPFVTTVTDPNTFQTITKTVIGSLPTTIRDYQRVAFAIAGGREWYLMQPAYCPGSHWRIGTDIGGRWGTSRLELNDLSFPNMVLFRHLSDVYGAVTVSGHTDLELQIGPASWFLVGFRVEWAYDWSDILKNATVHQSSNLNEVNLLFNTGFRF
jgi:hypothetical protein